MAPTTNMNLTLPVVSQTPGPEWASTINSDLSLIDAHDHTSTKGARIPVAALNINDNIEFFDTYGLTGVKRVTFATSTSAQPVQSVYVSGVDLYFQDGNNNQVQLTSGGSVAAAAGNISGLTPPANAEYIPGSKIFNFWSDTNTPANMSVGTIKISRNALSAWGVNISASASATNNYNLTLPPDGPAAVSLFCGSVGGAMSYVTTDSTLTLSSSLLKVANLGIDTGQLKDNAVTTAKILNGNVTTVKLGSVTVGTSSFITTTATTNTTPTAIPGLSATITVQANNRPIFVTLLGDYTSPARPYVSVSNISPDTFVRLYSSGLTYNVATIPVMHGVKNPANVFSGIVLPVSAVAGAVLTFQVLVFTQSGTGSITFNDVYLSAYQL